MQKNNINILIRDHELAQKEWGLFDVAQKAHCWISGLNSTFFGTTLPLPFLSFKEENRNVLGHFCLSYNDVGAENEINLNLINLNRSEIDVASTVLHEMGHLWQKLFGKAKKSRNNYHNVQLRAKLESFGIPCSKYGITTAIGGRFLAWARDKGLKGEPFFLPSNDDDDEPKVPKLKLWICSCDPPVRVRVGKSNFQAICKICKADFKKFVK